MVLQWALLLFTLPIHYFLTRDEKDRRVSLAELPKEIREKGYLVAYSSIY